MGKGAGWGALAGAFLGMVVMSQQQNQVEDLASQDAALIGVGFGALSGAVIGTIGGALTNGEKWQEVPLLPIRMNHIPRR